jgi:hypothetical protein
MFRSYDHHQAEKYITIAVQLLIHCQHFVEPEGSSAASQEPFTGPHPETDKSIHITTSYLS